MGAAAIGVAVLLGSGAALARDCTMLLPRPDGVLRLDTDEAVALPCGGPRRAYAALPPRITAPQTRPAAPASPQNGSGAVSLDAATADSLHRLQDETARLNSELSRLNDETARLRGETARLKEELARRAPASTAAVTSSIPPMPRTPTPTSSTSKALPTGEDKGTAAEREFEQQKSVVERAWSQLLEMATRMKRDLGSP
jgi:hypothetical protein